MSRIRVRASNSTEVASRMFETSHQLVVDLNVFKHNLEKTDRSFNLIYKGKLYSESNKQELVDLIEEKIQRELETRDLCDRLKQVVIY